MDTAASPTSSQGSLGAGWGGGGGLSQGPLAKGGSRGQAAMRQGPLLHVPGERHYPKGWASLSQPGLSRSRCARLHHPSLSPRAQGPRCCKGRG